MKKNTIMHYVYKITNHQPTDSRKFYIGVRTCKDCSPENDIQYWGSSKYLSEAISNTGVENFSKEILSIWKTRKEANTEEIRLHEIFNVSTNPEFYNKAIATSKRFSTVGMTNVINLMTGEKEFVTLDESKNASKYKSLFFDKVAATDKLTGEKVWVTKDEYKNSPNLIHPTTGKVTVVDKKTGIRKHVTKEEYRNNDDLISLTAGETYAIDTRTGKCVMVSTKDFKKFDYYVGSTKGYFTAFDKSKNAFRLVSKKEYENDDNLQTHSTKIIQIFDNNGVLQYTSNSNFSKLCEKHNLPLNAFKESYQQGGKALYENSYSNQSRLETYGYWKFKGWFAKEFKHSFEYGLVEVSKSPKPKKVKVKRGPVTRKIGQCKTIGIYDQFGNLMYQSNSNFKDLCINNDLPFNAFSESLQKNGKPLYENSYSNRGRLEANGRWKFKGWYAKEITNVGK